MISSLFYSINDSGARYGTLPTDIVVPDENVAVPTENSRWQFVRSAPDAQGNTPVTVTVPIATQKPLASVDVVASKLGDAKIEVLSGDEVVKLSSVAVSAATYNYTFRVTGKVAKDDWDTASIQALRYRVEGEEDFTEFKLGDSGIRINEMKESQTD